jgi:hypothetical protein
MRAKARSALNCPACNAPVADGTAICPQCDHIIDASFLDAESAAPKPEARRPSPKPAAPKSGTRPAAPKSGARPAVSSKPPATGAKPAVSSRPPGSASSKPPAARPSTPASGAAARERPSNPPVARAAPPPPKPAPAPRAEAPALAVPTNTSPGMRGVTGSLKIVAPEEMLGDLKRFVMTELGRSDKLAFLGALVTILLEFVPWRSTALDGDVIGFVTSGFLVLLSAIVTLSAIGIRVRKVMPQLNPIVPWLAQLGSVAFSVLWCLIFIKLNWDNTQVNAAEGNQVLAISSPSFGVVLALISSGVSMAGTLMGLKEKPN